jgi:hypothetical protein
MKKGWVLQYCDHFVGKGEGTSYTSILQYAHVFPTRAEARADRQMGEVVRRVLVNKSGQAYRIIPGR